MTTRQIARHRADVAAAHVHRPAAVPQHRGRLPQTLAAVVLALGVLLAVAVVLVWVFGR